MKKFSLNNPLSLFLLSFFLLFLFQCASSDSTFISDSCTKAAKSDPNISYDFCVAYLEAISKPELTTLEQLTGLSLDLAKVNATNVESNILKLLKDGQYGADAKACLKACDELYSDAVSDLDEAVSAFKMKDFDTAITHVSAGLDTPTTCEDQFKDKGVTSPLTKDNDCYFQLTAISLAFIQMCRQRT